MNISVRVEFQIITCCEIEFEIEIESILQLRVEYGRILTFLKLFLSFKLKF